MKVETSQRAAELIRGKGGRLYVWADSKVCCGGTRFIRTSTSPPTRAGDFQPIEADGFELFIKPAGAELMPDELHIDVAGRRRPRVAAYWNGCAYLV